MRGVFLDQQRHTLRRRAEKLLGRTLADRYRLDEVIGLGAMGVVYRAHHVGLRKDVALKLIHRELSTDEETLTRFNREAAAVSRLDHPNCVRVMDYGTSETGQRYLVMELLVGEDLSSLLREPIEPGRAIRIAHQILSGLEHAHSQDLIHRDVKPENIFVTQTEDGDDFVKLLDFGIVKVREGEGSSALTQMGMVFGTPQYMSPEQASGRTLDARADLYGVGVVMYGMLKGSLPFDGEDPMEVLTQQVQDPPPPLPSQVPKPLRRYVYQLLEKDPCDRFADATEARRALAAISHDIGLPLERSAPLGPAPVASPPQRDVRTVRWGAGLVGLGVVVGLGAFVALQASINSPAKTPPPKTTTSPREPERQRASASNDEVTVAPVEPPGHESPSEPSEPTLTATATDPPTPIAAPQPAPVPESLQLELDRIDDDLQHGRFAAVQRNIESLLVTYGDTAELYWRLGRRFALHGGPSNLRRAVQAYGRAATLKPALFDAPAFADEFARAVDHPIVRESAAEALVTVSHPSVYPRLATWLNVQTRVLPFALRHAVLDRLAQAGQDDLVNRPLQVALDLWQAAQSSTPCETFEQALKQATTQPDSYLLGTLENVAPPEECEESLVTHLQRVQMDYHQRYRGLTPTVPREYRWRR